MPKLFIIAGPPGIGKSTNGRSFVPPTVEILNHDSLAQYYKNKGEFDYQELSNLKANDFINEQLALQIDFGVELNLGFENHYDFLKYVNKKFPNYQIHLILFFTDNLQICLDRASFRALAGGHKVSPEVVKEMYENTLPLFQIYSKTVESVQFINVIDSKISPDLVYSLRYPTEKDEFIHPDLPQWVVQNFPKIVGRRI